MRVPCCWCGLNLNGSNRLAWVRQLAGTERPVAAAAVIPLLPPPPHEFLSVTCPSCRSTVYVAADHPVATA